MNTIFTEFENENALRTYPFASGCTVKDTDGVQVGTGVLIDAVLYPLNPQGRLYLSEASGGSVSISDESGVIMTGNLTRGEGKIELYETSGLRRHCGTLLGSSSEAMASLVNTDRERVFTRKNAMFASACVFPIVNDGVLSIDVGGTGAITGEVRFTNSEDDEVRVSTDGSTLRFDVIPDEGAPNLTSIQHIYCVVDGKTPFRIEKPDLDGEVNNTVYLYLDNIQRSDICSNAHREDALEMTDTCNCGSSSEEDEPVEIPTAYQTEAVDIPGEAEGAFFLAVPNMLGYDNPLSITMANGDTLPNTEISISTYGDNLSQLTDSAASNSVILQIPGMGE